MVEAQVRWSGTSSGTPQANVGGNSEPSARPRRSGSTGRPGQLRHSFVSLMSSSGVPVEEIARLAGHSNTKTTEVVYRRELRPVLTTGAEAMDKLFRTPAARAARARLQSE